MVMVVYSRVICDVDPIPKRNSRSKSIKYEVVGIQDWSQKRCIVSESLSKPGISKLDRNWEVC